MTEAFQLFELAQFIETRLEPSAARLGAASNHESVFARGELHEAVWWLLLGMELGCFPERESALVFGHYRQLLRRNYEAFVKFESWRFPPRLNAWMEAALSAPGSLPVLDHFDKPQALVPQFQASLAVSDQFVEDHAAQAFVRSESFSSDETWSALLAQGSSHEELKAILIGQGRPPAHEEVAHLAYSLWEQRGRPYGNAVDDWLRAEGRLAGKPNLLGGFLRTLVHMDASQQFFQDLEQWTLPTFAAVTEFARRAGEIQVWRLNFWNVVVQSRFEEVALTARHTIAAELKESEGDEGEADEFHRATLKLMQMWKQNHRPAQLAAAG